MARTMKYVCVRLKMRIYIVQESYGNAASIFTGGEATGLQFTVFSIVIIIFISFFFLAILFHFATYSMVVGIINHNLRTLSQLVLRCGEPHTHGMPHAHGGPHTHGGPSIHGKPIDTKSFPLGHPNAECFDATL